MAGKSSAVFRDIEVYMQHILCSDELDSMAVRWQLMDAPKMVMGVRGRRKRPEPSPDYNSNLVTSYPQDAATTISTSDQLRPSMGRSFRHSNPASLKQ